MNHLAFIGADFSPGKFMIGMFVVLLGFTVHEYAHAKLADAAGDPTPSIYGRVTLNPIAHLDPLGTIMLFFMALTGYGIAWGKPVPMDPRKMRNPRWDHFMAVFAGPLSNLLQAIVYALIFRIILMTDPSILRNELVAYFFMMGVIVNLGLCFFNLIPLGPLDGMWLLGTFLPERLRFGWTRWNLQIGSFLLLFLILSGQFSGFSFVGVILVPVIDGAMRILMGR